jgi:hypothetical protein
VGEPLVQALYRCEFKEDGQNAILVGGLVRKNSPCYGHWCKGNPTEPLPSPFFIDDRVGKKAH